MTTSRIPPWTLARALSKLNMNREPDWDRMADGVRPMLWKRFAGDGDTLDRLCGACPDAKGFILTLFFAHLLDPPQTPSAVSQWLDRKESLLETVMTCSPKELEQGTWRVIPVPLAHTERGYVIRMLVGAGPNLELFPCGSDLFDDQAIRAVQTAQELVRNTWDTRMAVCPLAWNKHDRTIVGPSLGLPVFLGAAAACKRLPCSHILATGCLGSDGSVVPVGHVREKIRAAGREIIVCILPENTAGEDIVDVRDEMECVPVATVKQACAVLACHSPGLGIKIAGLQKILESEHGLERELCGLVPGLEIWVQNNWEQISLQLSRADDLKPVIAHVEQWCHSTTGKDQELGNAVLNCFDPDMVRELGTRDHLAAWRISLLQLDRANHWGRIDVFAAWNRVAQTVRQEIVRLRQGDEEMLLHAIRIFINDSHNRFDFDPRLPERMEESLILNDIVENMEAAWRRKCWRCGGPCEDGILGQYFGTLGQHFMFCGREYHEKGMHYLQKAMQAFGDGNIAGDCRIEWQRDVFYLAFAMIEAGRFKKAEEHLGEACEVSEDMTWPVQTMNPFQIHGLLRLHIDADKAMKGNLWSIIRKRISDIKGYPIQLITLNLALLARKREERKSLYELSLKNCLTSGPSIQVMALLPLAHMFAEDMDFADMARMCEQVRDIIKDSGLHAPHFATILDEDSWQDMLKTVLAEKTKLFPYMYR